MPSTVADIFAAAGATPAGVAGWTQPVVPPPAGGASTGIYIVSLSDAVDRVGGTLPNAPIARHPVQVWLGRRPELLMLDDEGQRFRPSVAQLQQRLGQFWFPDESVLYIGLAGVRDRPKPGGFLANRVTEYYDTRIGAGGPHAGGFPLKTLSCLGELYVHYAYCDDVATAEGTCIGHFARNVSAASLAGLRDQERVMPFANLEYPRGTRKNHGIKRPRGPLPKSSLTAAELRRLY